MKCNILYSLICIMKW